MNLRFVAVIAYAPPTNPSVATLMRTVGEKTERSALKQAPRVEPVVNTSSTRTMCLGPDPFRNFAAASSLTANAPATFRAFPSMSSFVCVLVLRLRMRMSVRMGTSISRASAEAITSA